MKNIKNIFNKLNYTKLPSFSYGRFLIEKSIKRRSNEVPPTRKQRQDAIRIFLYSTRK